MSRAYSNYADIIDFTRASSGTALRPISYGSELVTNGTFDTSDGWTLVANHAITGGELVLTSAVDTTTSTYDAGIQAGKVYEVTFTIVSRSVGGCNIQIGGNPFGYLNSAGTYTRIIIGGSSNSLVGVRAVGTTTMTFDNISVREVLFDQPDGTLTLFNHPNNVPRIEYDADGNLLGLLVEEARTNSRVYSENLTQDGFTSNSGGSVVLSDSQPDPNGGSTGYTLFGITANGDYQGLYTQTAVTSGQTITGSIWLKGTAGQIIQIRQTRHGTGTFEETLKAVTLTGQWQRESVSHTYAYNQTSSRFDIGAISSGFSVSSISFAWCQLEVGSFPTSYIPTSGSTATRSADVASLSTSAFGYNDAAGTLYVDGTFRDAETIVTLGSTTIDADADGRKDYTATYSADPSATSIVLNNGLYNSLKYYPRVLTPAQLEALTS